MKMIASRIDSVHTYNEDTANKIVADILHTYSYIFGTFRDKMSEYDQIKNPDLVDHINRIGTIFYKKAQ